MRYRPPYQELPLSRKLGKDYAQDPEFQKMYKEPISPFEVKNGILYRDNRLCVPKGEFRTELLHDYHTTPNTGHLGETKTRHRIQPYYYWKGMRQTIHEYVKELSYLSAKPKHGITNHSVFYSPWTLRKQSGPQLLLDFINATP